MRRTMTIRDFRGGSDKTKVFRVQVKDWPPENGEASIWGIEEGTFGIERCLKVFPSLCVVVVRERKLKHQD